MHLLSGGLYRQRTSQSLREAHVFGNHRLCHRRQGSERQSCHSGVSNTMASMLWVLLWFCFLEFFNFILCVLSLLSTCIYMNHACDQWPQSSEQAARSPRDRVIEASATMWVLGIKAGSSLCKNKCSLTC